MCPVWMVQSEAMGEYGKCTMRGLEVLRNALERLREDPPAEQPVFYERADFLYEAHNFIAKKMAEKGYKVYTLLSSYFTLHSYLMYN